MRKTILTMALIFACSAIAFAGDSTEVKHKMDSTEHKHMMDSTEHKHMMDSTEHKHMMDSSEHKHKMDSTEMKSKISEMKTTKLGVKYIDLVAGNGKECKLGSKVECHYTLWFADDNGKKKTRFQSSKDPNPNTGKSTTFVCTLGERLISGWSDGMVGMKEGGTRMMIIPPHLGYGKGGRGIPANTTLVFEIDFVKLIK